MADRRLSLLWTAPSRALKYLPATALCLDLAIVTAAGSIAVMGRQTLGIFDPAGDVSNTLGLSVPLIIFGWVLTIGLSGGYRSDVFGAGTDEYKQIIRAGLLAAGLVGVTRGIHAEPWDKLVSLATGRVFAAWVDLREGATFGEVFHLELCEDHREWSTVAPAHPRTQ